MHVPISEQPITVAATGGGAYGAFTRGVLEVIQQDARYPVSHLVGFSAGAIAAASYAYDVTVGAGSAVQHQIWEDVKRTAAPWLTLEHQLGGDANPFIRIITEQTWHAASFGTYASELARPGINRSLIGQMWTALKLFPDQTDLNPLVGLLQRNLPDAQRVLWRPEAPTIAMSAVDVLSGQKVIVRNKNPDGTPSRDFNLTHWAATGALYPLIPAVTMNLGGKTRIGLDGVYAGEFAPWDALPKNAPRRLLCIDLGPPQIAKRGSFMPANPLVASIIEAHDLTKPKGIPDGFDVQVLRYNPPAGAKEGNSGRPTDEVLQHAFDEGTEAAQEWLSGGGFDADPDIKRRYQPRQLGVRHRDVA